MYFTTDWGLDLIVLVRLFLRLDLDLEIRKFDRYRCQEFRNPETPQVCLDRRSSQSRNRSQRVPNPFLLSRGSSQEPTVGRRREWSRLPGSFRTGESSRRRQIQVSVFLGWDGRRQIGNFNGRVVDRLTKRITVQKVNLH